jgi:hypothetical protein
MRKEHVNRSCSIMRQRYIHVFVERNKSSFNILMGVRYWATENVFCFMQNENFEVTLLVICWSAQLRMEHCCHLHSLLYSKSTCFSLWLTSAKDISHQSGLYWYHRHQHTEICNRNWLQRFTEILSVLPLLMLMVILTNPIKQTSKIEMAVTLCK